MKLLVVFALLFGILTSGCLSPNSRTFRGGRGDVGDFIASTVFAYGGYRPPNATNVIDKIDSRWSYQTGMLESGVDYVELELPRAAFPELESWLREAFGEPAHPVAWTARGTAYGAYDSRQIGVRIQFSVGDEETKCQVFRDVSR